MKRDIAEKWIAALRSGKYKQGRDALCRERPGSGDTFCCLGVLCDISGIGTWTPATAGIRDYGGRSGCLPPSVMEWAGMKSEVGDRVGLAAPLSKLNDDGYSFASISDIIEEEWESL